MTVSTVSAEPQRCFDDISPVHSAGPVVQEPSPFKVVDVETDHHEFRVLQPPHAKSTKCPVLIRQRSKGPFCAPQLTRTPS